MAILCGWPSTSTAQASDDDRPTPLLRGQAAPFTGQLLPVETAIRLGIKASQCNERTAAEVSRAVRLVEVDVELCGRRREIEAAAATVQLDLMHAEVEKAGAWYRDPIFVVPATAVLTAVLVVLARETIIDVR